MSNYEKISDEELIRRFRQGEEAVIDYLMEKYKYLVRRKVKTMYLLGGDSEDLIQEGMIGLYKAVRDFNPEQGTPFCGFADLCIMRQIYTAIEASQRKKHLPLNSYISLYATEEVEGERKSPLIDTICGEEENNPEQLVLQKEDIEWKERELEERLSELESRVLYLHLLGNDYQTIAGIMGKSPKTIDNAIQRIKAKAEAIVKGLDK